jgi:hypothetical protein
MLTCDLFKKRFISPAIDAQIFKPKLHNIDLCPEYWKQHKGYVGSRFCNLHHNKTYTKAESENRRAGIQGRKVCYQKKQGRDD